MLIQNNYPYPDINIFFLFGGVNEEYLEACDFKYPSSTDELLSKNTIDILNKLQSFFIVAESKNAALEYIKTIQPTYWKNYTFMSLSELKNMILKRKSKVIELSKDNKEDKIEYMIRYFDDPEINFVIAGQDLSEIKEWALKNKKKEVSYIMPFLALTEVVEQLTELKYGRNKENEVFVSSWENLESDLSKLYSNMSENEKKEILESALLTKKYWENNENKDIKNTK